MAKETINGTDNLSNGKDKINNNFTELYQKTQIDISDTVSSLTASDLNLAFPTAPIGFKVLAPSVSSGAEMYVKYETGWVMFNVTVL